jgi:hypothetical protein
VVLDTHAGRATHTGDRYKICGIPVACGDPVGLSASEARERLQAAGSRCDMTDPSAISCRYKDVQTPDSEYVDDVIWKVTVPLVNGRVADLKVARDWYRR